MLANVLLLFFFNNPASTDIYTLSLHDALPILYGLRLSATQCPDGIEPFLRDSKKGSIPRSEEHTSELQSRGHLVCRLLLEKKKYKFLHNHFVSRPIRDIL